MVGVSQCSTAGSTVFGGCGSSRNLPPLGGVMASAQSARQAPTRQTDSGPDNLLTSLIANLARLELEAFEAALDLQMYKEKKILLDGEGKRG